MLIRGAIPDGVFVQLWVAERASRTAYTATVVEAMVRATYASRDVADYLVAVGRPVTRGMA
jgi:hypothetical protein